MPRTKGSRKTQLSSVDEDQAQQLELLLRDFDRQLETHLAALKQVDNSKSYSMMARGEILKMSKAQRDRPAHHLLSLTPKGQTGDNNEAKPRRSTRAKSKKSEVAMAVDAQVNKAKEQAQASASKRPFKTPSRKRANNNTFAAITPKFNPKTPIPKSMMRVPKANETLVSLSGSPVLVAGAKMEDKNLAVYSMSKGKKMFFPSARDGPILATSGNLDEEDRDTLVALKNQIDNMLKITD